MIVLRGQQLAKGYMEGNLFWFDASKASLHAAAGTPLPIDIWHLHMGHISYNALTQYHNSVKGIAINGSINQTQSPCAGCELGKQARLPFSASAKRLDRWLRVVHSNLARLMQVQSIQGSRYIATFIDDYSHHGVVYFLKSKDQCATAFTKFLAWAKNQTSEWMLTLHSDRGGEYLSRAIWTILDQKGIEHKLTMLGSPQQNGLAK
jgi:transposase InsO family protein